MLAWLRGARRVCLGRPHGSKKDLYSMTIGIAESVMT
jgi:hypothetical protein